MKTLQLSHTSNVIRLTIEKNAIEDEYRYTAVLKKKEKKKKNKHIKKGMLCNQISFFISEIVIQFVFFFQS